MCMDSDCIPSSSAHFRVMLNNVLQTINDILKTLNAPHNQQGLGSLKASGARWARMHFHGVCSLLLARDDEGTAPTQEATAISHCTPAPPASARKL